MVQDLEIRLWLQGGDSEITTHLGDRLGSFDVGR